MWCLVRVSHTKNQNSGLSVSVEGSSSGLWGLVFSIEVGGQYQCIRVQCMRFLC